ncbi:MAG TPA: tRNA (adenosine(37)-N6)-threonylcarbamoyltransferase complex transferase subunit TsaD [Candidatus Woesebacteria bacterium]|nr:tRNA (adenosine(37)-N6)-threonylcarbamoyltransferase complex transferase subunit TsaD [Candidatus Woesebacteria bacterium]
MTGNNQKSLVPLILAIDTSCDDTSVAVVLGKVVLANVVASQTKLHAPYGGVFPTVAKQAHGVNIKGCVEQALKLAQVYPSMLTGVAVTIGPGLAPALEVGIDFAKQLAKTWQKPIFAANHIEAHLWSVLVKPKKQTLPVKSILSWIYGPQKNTVLQQNTVDEFVEINLSWPILGLVLSGGHSLIVKINGLGKYQVLGNTIDDALGEALDKVGRILNLGYPAGPVLEKLAKKGNSKAYSFPLPMTSAHNFNLSYSGLKTAAHRLIKQVSANNQIINPTKNVSNSIETSSPVDLTPTQVCDLASSFQDACFHHLIHKVRRVLETPDSNYSAVWLGGGVASNILLRKKLRQLLKNYHLSLKTPYHKRVCADNAAMIGVITSLKLAHLGISPANQLDRQPNLELPTL